MEEFATDAVLSVGAGGRGFIVDGGRERFVITAAHCLPFFPPCHGMSYAEERTYKGLLAPVGGEPSIWAECLFADPIADIAILGPVDGQQLVDQYSAYEDLMEGASPLAISDPPRDGAARMLSLDGRWFECRARHLGGLLWVYDAAESIRGGMSGSPILGADGSAIGVVCIGTRRAGERPGTDGGPNPRLAYSLPAWALTNLITSGSE